MRGGQAELFNPVGLHGAPNCIGRGQDPYCLSDGRKGPLWLPCGGDALQEWGQKLGEQVGPEASYFFGNPDGRKGPRGWAARRSQEQIVKFSAILPALVALHAVIVQKVK